jgi:hypothetical protein
MSASDIMLASSRISSDPGRTVSGPSASRRPSRWPRNRAVLYAWVTPAPARTFAAVWEVVSPITSPFPACCQIRAISATVRVLPDPAGPAMTSARRVEVSTRYAAAAWSRRNPDPVGSLSAPAAVVCA